MITLYSTHCPKCSVLEQKLKQKNIPFSIQDDEDEVVKYGREHNIRSAPLLDVDGRAHDFIMAIKFINDWKED